MHHRRVVRCVGFEPGLSRKSAQVRTNCNSQFWRGEGTIKIGCKSGFTNIASSPQLGNFLKMLCWGCFLDVLLHILGWGIHSHTFQSLKLDIEKVPCELFSLVQYACNIIFVVFGWSVMHYACKASGLAFLKMLLAVDCLLCSGNLIYTQFLWSHSINRSH